MYKLIILAAAIALTGCANEEEQFKRGYDSARHKSEQACKAGNRIYNNENTLRAIDSYKLIQNLQHPDWNRLFKNARANVINYRDNHVEAINKQYDGYISDIERSKNNLGPREEGMIAQLERGRENCLDRVIDINQYSEHFDKDK